MFRFFYLYWYVLNLNVPIFNKKEKTSCIFILETNLSLLEKRRYFQQPENPYFGCIKEKEFHNEEENENGKKDKFSKKR